jgi:PAS domain S-box-containing protein
MAEADLDLIDLLETSPVGTVIIDAQDQQVLFWNTSVLSILGGLQGESFAKAASHAFFHSQATYEQALAQLAQQGTLRNFETRIWREDGLDAWASITMRPIRFEGRPATLIWYFDVSDSKRRQQQLENSQDTLLEVLDAAPTGAALIDGPGRISYWNTTLLNLLAAGAGDTGEILHAAVKRAQSEIGQHGQGHAFSLTTADGAERDVAAWGARVDFEGAPSELIWLHDMTEQRRAERAAQAATAAKSAFLATMSHEIRTPMNGVVAIADLLADTALDAEQLQMIDIIRSSADGLIRVINDILDFSKLEANQLQIERVAFRLDELLTGVVQLLSAKAQEKGLALVIAGLDFGGPCRIGDPLRLRQILLNLVGNAIKFTATGQVTLAVEADAERVALRVIDTGIGIPQDKIADLFTPYHQVRADTARHYGGTGLGLSICDNLISLMGGRLTVTSEVGRGSCFCVALDLPISAEHAVAAAVPPVIGPRSWRAAPRDVAAAQGGVVLCVEDNAVNRNVLARVLDRLGICHEMAEDGVAALAALDRARHGAVLTDGHMPRMDGWALTEAIRAEEAAHGLARLPVLMVTANALHEIEDRAFVSGVDDFLTKPLRRDELEGKLLRAVPGLARLRMPADTPAAPPPPQPAALDIAVLVDLVGGDAAELRIMLDEFAASVREEHAGIRAAAAAGNAARLAGHAHALKGASRYAGAVALAALCDTLELRSKAGVAPVALETELAELDAAIARLPGEMREALDRHCLVA